MAEPVYAQVADVEDYIEGWTTDDEDALIRLIQRAERDIDSVIGPWGTTFLVGSHTFPAGTVYVGSTASLPATGSVIVQGQTLTYTGKTQTTLTGVTGGTGTFAETTPVRIVTAASGLKFDPLSNLSDAQAGAITRATCAQVEYRFTQGEEFFVAGQYQQVSGPDFSQTGVLPYIGRKVLQELEGYGLLLETCVG